ncbi:hypothetical protein [Agrobacterium sp. CG674]
MMSLASMQKLLPILMLLLAVSLLGACSASTPSARAPINLPRLPSELTCKPEDKSCVPVCPYAVQIPVRKLNQLETETYWLQDRKTLRVCRNNYQAVLDHYEDLRTNLSSPEK